MPIRSMNVALQASFLFLTHGKDVEQEFGTVRSNVVIIRKGMCGMSELYTEQERIEAIELCCISKAEELRLLGYEYVTGEDVWECVSAKYKKNNDKPALHRVVNDILSLKSTQFMNYMTMAAFRGEPI